MPSYEHVFLARQDITAQQAQALMTTFKEILEANGGQVGKTEYWGLKTIAYRIKKNRKAHYALMNIDAPAAAVAEMERQMGISTDVLRFITLRVDAHETEPSAMMRRGDDRDSRDRGGPRGGGGRFGDRGGGGGDRDRGPREDRGDRPPREGGERSFGSRDGTDRPREDRAPRDAAPADRGSAPPRAPRRDTTS